MGEPIMAQPVRRLLDGMLAEHGLTADRLYTDVPLGDRLRHTVHKGRDSIIPGPRFLMSGFETDDPARDVRLHWAALVAGALRRQMYGDTPPMHAYLVPTVARAVAVAAGWTPEGMVGAFHGNPLPRLKPVDTQWCRNSERVQGQMPNDISVMKRHETPAWFLHLRVEMHFSANFPISYADHRSIRLRNLPDTLASAIRGRRLHEVIALEGMEADTPAGDVIIDDIRGNNIMLPQMWRPAADAPHGEDMRWVDVALQAPFTRDDGSTSLN